MLIIIRHGLISYQSHPDGIMRRLGNKTQQGMSTDHTTPRMGKHKGGWMGCNNPDARVLFRTDLGLIYNLVWRALNVAVCFVLTRVNRQLRAKRRYSQKVSELCSHGGLLKDYGDRAAPYD